MTGEVLARLMAQSEAKGVELVAERVGGAPPTPSAPPTPPTGGGAR